jgi:hypothetical protein
MKRDEYISTRRKILEEAQATLDALDRVYAYLKEDGDKATDAANLPRVDSLAAGQSPLLLLEGEQAQTVRNGDTEKIRITEEVRSALEDIDGNFTQQSVTALVASRNPHAEVKPSAVASVLGRMTKRKSVKVVRKGYGSAPNVYHKTENWHIEKQIAEGLPPEEVEVDSD